MNRIKRVEIIIDQVHGERVLAALDRLEVSGYTTLANASGRGDRGIRRGDEFSQVASNLVIITTCPPGQLDALVEAVRPALKKYGGACLVSDAEWVIH